MAAPFFLSPILFTRGSFLKISFVEGLIRFGKVFLPGGHSPQLHTTITSVVWVYNSCVRGRILIGIIIERRNVTPFPRLYEHIK